MLARVAPDIASKLVIMTAQPTQNMEAYDLVLQGRYLLARRGEDAVRNALKEIDALTELEYPFFYQSKKFYFFVFLWSNQFVGLYIDA